jgi:two-component system, NarL family, response regulator NreC
MALRLILADDHHIVRQGLRALLEREGFEIAAEAADGNAAVTLVEVYHPDIAILDLSMPGLNGVDAAREILQRHPKVGIILLTVHNEDYQVVTALRAGIRGYVIKTQAADELVRAIREVATGGMYLSPEVSRIMVGAYLSGAELPADPLTPRERQILQLIAEGNTTKEVAVLLGLSTKTAESYRARIMEKLDIHQTAGLVRYAIRRGLIEP